MEFLHPIFPPRAFVARMGKIHQPWDGRHTQQFDTTTDRMERYFAQHPRSPSAVRRPQLFRRGETFVALHGANLQNGIAGLGNTVEAALRAFDVQYARALRPLLERTKTPD